ncbi:hypothetical protein LEN26_015698 [Aphanomyces euteiches]|uniref:Uncharacterized protein n=1 Tax=Aphanomyces euteiches TaxID=100861 RepID=A0A6G0WRM4_9STRA|nr:hypothetical protein Ae201684_012460 [Aphanomyces euteiches]KAH9101356.1 hypothetical protein LEN26_015698 [Aphanomyces euteiches]KAH9113463.1 hypothetical protein AeMF1_012347 [Aphanomyces euteiches]KAH9137671.1 hypothetical protein AeRB84_017709 [Aphanomyces euteiches]
MRFETVPPAKTASNQPTSPPIDVSMSSFQLEMDCRRGQESSQTSSEDVGQSLRGFFSLDDQAHEILEEMKWRKTQTPQTPRRILLRVRSPSLGSIEENQQDE